MLFIVGIGPSLYPCCFVGSRGGDRVDAFSAPTSPTGPQSGIGAAMADGAGDGQQSTTASGSAAQQQTTILRNPLRGSKCNCFWRFCANCESYPFLYLLLLLTEVTIAFVLLLHSAEALCSVYFPLCCDFDGRSMPLIVHLYREKEEEDVDEV